ncbi:hypothetical protein M9458_001483, partial [Cirrhinus mrigala]
MTGNEEGEREGGRIGKGPQARTQTWDARSTMALHVGALPTRLSLPTRIYVFGGKHFRNYLHIVDFNGA